MLAGGSDGKESPGNARDVGSVPGLGRSPGEGNGSQHSCLGNPVDRALAGHSPWGCGELDTTGDSQCQRQLRVVQQIPERSHRIDLRR